SHGSYPRSGWGYSILHRNVDLERAAMNQPEAGEAPEAAHGRSDLQKELAEVLQQRAAISEVLRVTANSPHDLQPIFDTIIDNAVRLCRAEVGSFRRIEEGGLRLVAYKGVLLKGQPPPTLLGHSSFLARIIAGKSPVHMPHLAAHVRVGEAYLAALVNAGLQTGLYVPMLRNDELIGVLSLGRWRMEPFTEKEIELVTDFAAEAAIALEITRRERQLRELQMHL